MNNDSQKNIFPIGLKVFLLMLAILSFSCGGGSLESHNDSATEASSSSHLEGSEFKPHEDVSVALVKACGICHEFVKDMELVQLKSAAMLERFKLPSSNRMFMPTGNPDWPNTEEGRLVISYLEGLSSEEN